MPDLPFLTAYPTRLHAAPHTPHTPAFCALPAAGQAGGRFSCGRCMLIAGGHTRTALCLPCLAVVASTSIFFILVVGRCRACRRHPTARTRAGLAGSHFSRLFISASLMFVAHMPPPSGPLPSEGRHTFTCHHTRTHHLTSHLCTHTCLPLLRLYGMVAYAANAPSNTAAAHAAASTGYLLPIADMPHGAL